MWQKSHVKTSLRNLTSGKKNSREKFAKKFVTLEKTHVRNLKYALKNGLRNRERFIFSSNREMEIPQK